RYEDGLERWHDVSDETKQALRRAMGASESDEPDPARLLIVKEDSIVPVPANAEIELEDGRRLHEAHALPLGYHRIRQLDSGEETRLIVAPETCHLRRAMRVWGWTLQLYALRSAASWGIGDLEDLKQLCTWSADILNASVIMTNPLSAAAPSVHQQPSPYFPSSRLFRNPLYLRIEEIPGAREALPDLEQYAARGRALNEAPLIDRDAIYKLKMEALDRIWTVTRSEAKFDEYAGEQGQNLAHFAAFCALAERFGPNWHDWPDELQHPDAPAVKKFAAEASDRIRFHAWVQWLIDRQLLRASERRMIVQDLPIGVDPAGADSWIWQDVFAKEVSVGSPPDPFSETGQNWGLPPFVPHKLRQAGYEPFVQTLRSAMCHSVGLRIDHVMGLFRLFWIPQGASPQRGTYVRYPADEMLSILALESERARAFVVGEDLGTVEPGVREKLAQFGVLSYRVLWFEENPPREYPELSLASISTHDLPTIAGVWSGADFEEQKQCGMKASEEGAEKQRKQLQKVAEVTEDAPVREVIVKAHQALAEAPSVLILASLEDALGFEKRPNLPGITEDKRPNWSIPLPKKLEEIETDPAVLEIAGILREGVMKISSSASQSQE
ncbi:MAG: 4-alpha-glucanotransferase, partial [Acidobacteriaceae bacterium]|nr:4-alpha-glucanotransferase [Acidobacteriaceae bacterium]